MNKIIFIFVCIFCLCATNVQAQYKSFFADSTWEYDITFQITCYCSDYNPQTLGGCRETGTAYFSKSDTLMVDSLIYYRSKKYVSWFDNVFIREDTILGKLYRYDAKIKREYLLCDLSLNIGDTFHLFDQFPMHLYKEFNQNGDYIVDTVYYVNGLKYLELHKSGDPLDYEISQPEYNISFRFMESIGPMYGLGTIQPSMENKFPLLLCIHKDDTLYYMTHEDLQCEQYRSSIDTYDDAIMNIYPNPASDKITVSFENGTAEDGTLYLLDIMGRILWQGKVTDNLQTVSVRGYAPGLYTVLYRDSQGRKAKKVLIQ